MQLNGTYTIHPVAQNIAAFQPHPPTAVGTLSKFGEGKEHAFGAYHLLYNFRIGTFLAAGSRPYNTYYHTTPPT